MPRLSPTPWPQPWRRLWGSNPVLIFWWLLVALAAYPFLWRAIYGGVFLAGMVGCEELFLPAWLGRAVSWFLRPTFGGRSADAITSGVCTMYLIPNPSKALRDHEGFHRFQSFREAPHQLPHHVGVPIGCAIYGVKYFIEYCKVGYFDNKYEREARIAAGQE